MKSWLKKTSSCLTLHSCHPEPRAATAKHLARCAARRACRRAVGVARALSAVEILRLRPQRASLRMTKGRMRSGELAAADGVGGQIDLTPFVPFPLGKGSSRAARLSQRCAGLGRSRSTEGSGIVTVFFRSSGSTCTWASG
jgi:hypothetical protein